MNHAVLTLTPAPLSRRTRPLALLLAGAVIGAALGVPLGGALAWLVGAGAAPLLSAAAVLGGAVWGGSQAARRAPREVTGRMLTLYGPTPRPLQLHLDFGGHQRLRDAQDRYRGGGDDTLVRYVTQQEAAEFYVSEVRTTVTGR